MVMSRRKYRVLVTGAGGPAAVGFARSLMRTGDYYLIGVDCDPYGIHLAHTHEKILVPKAHDKDYIPFLQSVILDKSIDFLHAQPDVEIEVLADNADKLHCRTFLPNYAVVSTCQDKWKSAWIWDTHGVIVPKTWLVEDEDSIKTAFREIPEGPLWLRSRWGAAGKGSLKAASPAQAIAWVNEHRGWGDFTIAEYLPGFEEEGRTSTTWTAIYHGGNLVVGQGRDRVSWAFADRSATGVTGLTGVGKICSSSHVAEVAQKAILAIDPRAHGIYSVDMTYNAGGVPCPTEINIGRFFTTHEFLTAAGLNLPDIYVRLGMGEHFEMPLGNKVNPLSTGLHWIRSVDSEPVMRRWAEIKALKDAFERRKQELQRGRLVPG